MRNTWSGRRSPMVRAAAVLLAATLVVPGAIAPAGAQQQPRLDAAPDETKPGVPLTLREALALALDNNLTIAVQRYEPSISDTSILFERGVFDPSLNLFGQEREATSLSANPFQQSLPAVVNKTRFGQATYTDPFAVGGTLTATLDGSVFKTSDPRFAANPILNSSLTISYDQSLLRNFGYDVNRAGIRVAQRNLEISESQFRQTVIDTIQLVEKAYWDVKFALEDLQVKRHSLALSEETLAQNKIRVEVGTMAPIDVTTAEAEVASRSQDVLVAENTLENAQDALIQLLNMPKTSPLWDLPVRPVDELPFSEESGIDVDAAIEEAFASRPDLEQTRFQMQNDEDLVKQARNATRWDLVARAQYERAGLGFDSPAFDDPNTPLSPDIAARDDDFLDAFRQIHAENFDTWLVSLNLQIPLGNKQARSQYLAARLRQQQREQTLDSQQLNAVIAVRTAARSVENTIERVKAARVNVRLQRERLDAENKRYENGMTTTFDLFQFQDDLTRAESQVILALVDYNKALADLEAAKGTLARARGVQVAELMQRGGVMQP